MASRRARSSPFIRSRLGSKWPRRANSYTVAAGRFEGEMVVEEAISSSGLSSGLGRMMKPTRSPGEIVFENEEV